MAIKISGSTIIDDSRVIVNADKIGIGTPSPTRELSILSPSPNPTGIGVSAANEQSTSVNKAISVFNAGITSTFAVSYTGIVSASEYFGTFKGDIDPGVPITNANKIKINHASASNDFFNVPFFSAGLSNGAYGDIRYDNSQPLEYNPFLGNLRINSGAGNTALIIRTTSNALDRAISFQNSGGNYVGYLGMDNIGSDAADMVFGVDLTNESVATNVTERLRITNAGITSVKGADDQDNFMVDVNGTQFAVHTDATDGELSLRAQDGTLNNFSKFMTFYTQKSGEAASEKVRITSDGIVGIGTTNPTGAQKLNVYADSNGIGGIIQITQDGTGDAAIDFQLKGLREYSLGIDNSDDDKFKLSSTAGVDSNTIFTATTDGDVGIGTDNPDHIFHVFHPTENNIALFESGDPFGSIGLSDSNGSVALVTTLGKLLIKTDGDAGTVGTNSDLAMVIEGGGDVGIGTDNPGSKLDVLGDVNVGIATLFVKESSGRVGIATDNPGALLHIQGVSGDAKQGLRFRNQFDNIVNQYFSNASNNSDFVITYSGTGGAELTLHADGDLGLNEGNGDDVFIGTGSAEDGAKLTIKRNDVGFATAIALSNSNGSGDGSKIVSNKSLVLGSDHDANHSNEEKNHISFQTRGVEKVRINLDGDLLRGGTGQDIGASGAPWDKVYANEFIGLVNTTQENITTGNLLVTGIATFQGNVSIAGTLTYEDVTNIDSIGIITARSGIHVIGAGVSVTGISTFHDKVGIGNTVPNATLEVNGPIKTNSGTYKSPDPDGDQKDDAALVMPFDSSIYTEHSVAGLGTYLRTMIGVKEDDSSQVIQIGQNGTALIDEIRMMPGNAGFFSVYNDNSEALRITSGGQIGLKNNSPKEWHTDYKTLQIYDAGYVAGSADDSFVAIGANNYIISSGMLSGYYAYCNNDFASQLYQVNGELIFRNAASGTADNTITWSEKLRIDSTGAVRINTTRTTATKLHVVGGTASGTSYDTAIFAGGQNSTAGSGARIYLTGCENDPLIRGVMLQSLMTDNGNTHDFIIRVGGPISSTEGERLRITTAGNVGIGTDNPIGTNAVTNNNTTLAVGIVTANEYYGTFKGTIDDDVIAETAQVANKVSLGFDNTGGTAKRMVFTSSSSGDAQIQVDMADGVTYQPSTGTIGAQRFSGTDISVSDLSSLNHINISGIATISSGAFGNNVTVGERTYQTNVDLRVSSLRSGIVVRNMNNFRTDNTNNSAFMVLDPFTNSNKTFAFRAAEGTGANDITTDLGYDAAQGNSTATLFDTFWVKTNGDGYFNGKVGIGTSIPTSHLQVYRPTEFAGNPIIQARSNNGSTNELKFEIDGDGDAYFNGNVGAGTNDPQERLHVHSSGTSCILVSGTTAPQIRLNPSANDASDNDRSAFGQATGSNNFVNGATAGDTVLRGTSTGSIRFGHGTSMKLHINNDGDLLRGGTSQDIGASSAPWDKIYANEFVGLINTTQENVTTGNLLVTGISTFVGVATFHAVGIGTDSADSAKLEINVGSAVTALDIQGSEGQLFSVTNNLTTGSIFAVNDVSGTPSINVDADGTIQLAPFLASDKIGIGTTNPAHKLDVIGDAFVNGALFLDDTENQIEKITGAAGHLDLFADSSIRLYESDANSGAGRLGITFDINQTATDRDVRIHFMGESTTYLHSPAANTLGFKINNNDTLRLADSKVGVNVTDPHCALDVRNASGTDPLVELHHSDYNVLGEVIRIGRVDDDAIRYHSIKAKHHADANANQLQIFMHDGTGSPAIGQTEVVRIRGDGKVGIGTDSIGSSSPRLVVQDSMQLRSALHNTILFFQRTDNNANAWIGIPEWNDTAFYIFGPTTSSNEVAAAYGGGDWTFSAGGTTALKIKNATGTATTAVNIGGDYNQTLRTVKITGDAEVTGTLFANISGTITPTGDVDISGNLDVDGHTDLDNVNIAGVTTFASNIKLPDDVQIQLGNADNGDFVLVHDSDDSIINNATGDLFYRSATHRLQALDGTDRLHIDTSGRILIGHSVNRPTRTGTSGYSGLLQLESNSEAALTMTRFGTTHPSRFNLQHSRGTISSPSAAVNNDDIGQISFSVYDGSNFTNAAEIIAEVDGIVGVNSMPGRLIFKTTPDNSTTATERVRIEQDGKLRIGTASPIILTASEEEAVQITSEIRNSNANNVYAFRVDVDDKDDSVSLTGDRRRGSGYFRIDADSDQGDTSDELIIQNLVSDVNCNKDYDTVRGIFADVNISHETGEGTISNAYGVYSEAQITDTGAINNIYGGLFSGRANGANATSAVSQLYGIRAIARHTGSNSGNTGTMVGVRGEVQIRDNVSTRRTATNAYSFYADLHNDNIGTPLNEGNVVSNRIAMYFGDISGSERPFGRIYGLYLQDVTDNYLAGNLQVVGVTTVSTLNATTINADNVVGPITGEASQVSIANGANNRILTAASANTINAESNLTFDGSDLFVANNIKHLGDTDTQMGFGTNEIKFDAGSSEQLRIQSDALNFKTPIRYGSSTSTLLTSHVYVRGTAHNNTGVEATRVVTLNGEDIIPNDSTGIGLVLVVLNAGSGISTSSITRYNTHNGGTTPADSMATKITDMTRDQIGIIASYDACMNAVTDNLRTAAQKVGLFKLAGISGHTSGQSRLGYAAIFRGTSNDTSAEVNDAIEVVQAYSANAGPPTAVITTHLASFGSSGRDAGITGAHSVSAIVAPSGSYEPLLLQGKSTSPTASHLSIGSGVHLLPSGSASNDTDSNGVDLGSSSNYLRQIYVRTLNADNITADVTGAASQVTAIANNSTSTAYRVPFLTAATGAAQLQTDSADGISYNPGTGELVATKFNGDGSALTGITGSSGALTDVTVLYEGRTAPCTLPITISTPSSGVRQINIPDNSNAFGAKYVQNTEPTGSSVCDGDVWYDTTASGGGSSISFSNSTEATYRNITFADNSSATVIKINDSGKLQVRPNDGALKVEGDVIAFASSDERLKDNIKPIDNPLEKVMKISGNTFEWNEKSLNTGMDVGVIAQEVEKLELPGLTTTRKDNGTKAVRYERLIPLLIEAIKELKGEIDELKRTK